MEDLYREFKESTAFFVVYVREAHPGGRFPQTTTYEEKRANAAECRRQCGITIPILVDNMEEEVHKLYGSLPNMIYIIDKEGRVVYRATWTHSQEVRQVLEGLRQRDEALAQGIRLHSTYSEKLQYATLEEEMARAANELAVWESYEDYDEPERFFGPERGQQIRKLAARWRARAGCQPVER